MVRTCGRDLVGLRDRALLLLGFAGAFRRADQVALRVDDLVEDAAAGGIRITRLGRARHSAADPAS
jgi:hypothetical protein